MLQYTQTTLISIFKSQRWVTKNPYLVMSFEQNTHNFICTDAEANKNRMTSPYIAEICAVHPLTPIHFALIRP